MKATWYRLQWKLSTCNWSCMCYRQTATRVGHPNQHCYIFSSKQKSVVHHADTLCKLSRKCAHENIRTSIYEFVEVKNIWNVWMNCKRLYHCLLCILVLTRSAFTHAFNESGERQRGENMLNGVKDTRFAEDLSVVRFTRVTRNVCYSWGESWKCDVPQKMK